MYLDGLDKEDQCHPGSQTYVAPKVQCASKRKSDESFNTTVVRKRLYFDQHNVEDSRRDNFDISDAQPDFDLDWDDWEESQNDKKTDTRSEMPINDQNNFDDVIWINDENSPPPEVDQYFKPLTSPEFPDNMDAIENFRPTPDDTPVNSRNVVKMHPKQNQSFISKQKSIYHTSIESNMFTPNNFHQKSWGVVAQPSTSSLVPIKNKVPTSLPLKCNEIPGEKHNSFMEDIFTPTGLMEDIKKSSPTDHQPIVASIKKADKKELEKAQKIYFSILDSFDL